ncbi:MAG: SUMF1/EgtB/PvdO family nonheme iron enzyme [Luteitalea sp.]|nr:SUMF1/EgtB/PvdO family nonheme iron enzyme [Luteitalea sp.]
MHEVKRQQSVKVGRVAVSALALVIAVMTMHAVARPGPQTPGRGSQPAAQSDEPFKSGATYVEKIPETNVSFEMVAVPGGTFMMGSPASESGRRPDEGPQVEVELAPFWISKHEVTWDEFDEFAFARGAKGLRTVDSAAADADALTRPSRPYGDESRGFGKGKQPAIGMTHHAAMEYCRWLSKVTGQAYRLATEAEWEYAARAGDANAAPESLAEGAWFAENADGEPHPVGGKQPNPWQLQDMLGNVAEWVLDQYDGGRYQKLSVLPQPLKRPVLVPDDRRFPHGVRGGSYLDGADALRYAARVGSSDEWSMSDPQQPQSIWWHPDESFVGVRIVRAVEEQPELRGLRSKVTQDSM